MPSKRTPNLSPEKLQAAIEFARKAGVNAATDWDSESGVDQDQHRMRSLMNFERDVVKSTADDGDAMPQWSAFVDAYESQSKATSGTFAPQHRDPEPKETTSLPDVPDSIDLLGSLRGVLLQISGTAASIRSIAEDLPETQLSPTELCPEYVFASLGQYVFDACEKAHSIFWDMEVAIKAIEKKGGE